MAKNAGTSNSLPNDNGIGGAVGVAHYNLWRTNFGNPGSGSGSGLSASAVPEPSTFTLAALIAAVGCCIESARQAAGDEVVVWTFVAARARSNGAGAHAGDSIRS